MIDAYLDSLQAQGKSTATIKTYRTQLSLFFRWLEGKGYESNPKEITQFDIADYRNHLQEQGRLPRTVNTALAAIEAFCKWLVDEGHITFNPADRVKRIKQVTEPPKWLTRSERARLLRVAEREKDMRNTVLVLTLLMSGLRASELVNLKHDDIIIGERKGSIVVRHGKGNKRRTVPIERDLRNWLGKYITEVHPTGEWLFPSQRGERLTYDGLHSLCRNIGEKAKIDGLTPHMLRHTFGHELASRDVPLQVIASLMGHDSINTTMIYTTPGTDELQAAVDKLSYT